MYAVDHPEFGRFERAQLWKDVVKIVLYERDKGEKLAMIWRDYRAGAGSLGSCSGEAAVTTFVFGPTTSIQVEPRLNAISSPSAV